MFKQVCKNYLTNVAKRLETKNLKKCRRSTAWITLLNLFNQCIVEIYIDKDSMLIDTAKLSKIKKENTL